MYIYLHKLYYIKTFGLYIILSKFESKLIKNLKPQTFGHMKNNRGGIPLSPVIYYIIFNYGFIPTGF